MSPPRRDYGSGDARASPPSIADLQVDKDEIHNLFQPISIFSFHIGTYHGGKSRHPLQPRERCSHRLRGSIPSRFKQCSYFIEIQFNSIQKLLIQWWEYVGADFVILELILHEKTLLMCLVLAIAFVLIVLRLRKRLLRNRTSTPPGHRVGRRCVP